MLLTTTQTIQGHQISNYLGVVCAEVIFGANIARDWMAKLSDVVGGHVGGYEKVFAEARAEAFRQIEQQASDLGANVVVGIRIDYETLGQENTMLMVAVTGTAVVVEVNGSE